ncbi:hypothetical protein MNV49_002283 [Pseudohyphozyma bogoriensis]|nr:hypothetical protein MNV49_002283 [Pseudohyphozyma bogoriensis]
MMDRTLAAGKKRLEKLHGPNFFLSEAEGGQAGHFWGLLDTRPWMRLQSAIGELAAVGKDWDRAVAALSECLRLCPGDNLGMRSKLTPWLIQAGRPADGVRFQLNWLLHTDNPNCCPPLGGLDLSTFPTVDKDLTGPLSDKIKEKIKNTVVAEMLYDLALATKTAFGDCELARLALKIASEKNPVVIGHILGKKGAPKDYNREPRTLNSPQTANDYLHLSYHLWMEPTTFAWAKNDKEVHKAVLKSCEGGCGKKEEKHLEFQGCSACKRAFCCGPGCQKKDWPKHKKRTSRQLLISLTE